MDIGTFEPSLFLSLTVNHSKGYSSVAFSTFIMCSCHLCLVPKHFQQPQRRPEFTKRESPSLSPSAPANLFLSIDLFWVFYIIRILQQFTFYLASLARVGTSLLLTAEYYSIFCVCHILFVHSSMDGHLGGFHLLTLIEAEEHLCKRTCLHTYFQFLQL